MNAIERELEVARAFASCRGDVEYIEEVVAEIAELRAENDTLRRLVARYRRIQGLTPPPETPDDRILRLASRMSILQDDALREESEMEST